MPRARAVTLGDIARLQAQRGEVEEALRLHHEGLEVHRRLGDVPEQAAALWDIAWIELNRGHVEQAAPMLLEAYQMVDHLGRLDGICVVGQTLGRLLIAADMREEGLALLQRSDQGYRQLQRSADADAVAAFIAQLEQR